MHETLRGLYESLASDLQAADESDYGRPTRTAWTVRELLFHQLLDAQRTLVALASPTEDPPDVDAVTYWRSFRPSEGDDGAPHARFVRVAASAYGSGDHLLGDFETTAAAAVRALGAAEPGARVHTQGHVITVADLASTLVVEATVHLLDLTVDLDAARAPAPAALVEARRVLEAINGAPLPARWDDTEAVLKGTGRTDLTSADRADLGELASGLPLLG